MDVKEIKKDNFFVTIIKGLKSEWMKIIFPTGERVLNDSVKVLICSVVIGFIIFALDAVIGAGFGFLFNK